MPLSTRVSPWGSKEFYDGTHPDTRVLAYRQALRSYRQDRRPDEPVPDAIVRAALAPPPPPTFREKVRGWWKRLTYGVMPWED